jgi:hypothetical protein
MALVMAGRSWHFGVWSRQSWTGALSPASLLALISASGQQAAALQT